MANFVESGAKRDGKFAAIVKCCEFCFGCGGHDMYNDGQLGEYGAVVKFFVAVVGEIEVA
jgi:hypothetical protein